MIWFRQLRGTVAVLPRTTSLSAFGCMAATSILVTAFASGADGALVHRSRVMTAFTVASSLVVLDDEAAATTAPSPTSLWRRNSFRLLVLLGLVGAQWSALLLVLSVRTSATPVAGLARETALLTAVGCAVSYLSRRRNDGRGAVAGGLASLTWYVVSLVPRVPWVPRPPNPFDHRAAGRVALLVLLLATAVVALSRDPAATLRCPSVRSPRGRSPRT